MKSAVVFYLCGMKLEITNVFDIRRTDGKPITGKLKGALKYLNMYSMLCLAQGGTFELNGFWFRSTFEDQLRVEVFLEEPPADRYCELIFDI